MNLNIVFLYLKKFDNDIVNRKSDNEEDSCYEEFRVLRILKERSNEVYYEIWLSELIIKLLKLSRDIKRK